jgi:hypothetical protein
MAEYTAQIVLQDVSGLPRDNSVNVYHFTSGANTGTETLATDLRNAYQTHLVSNAAILGGVNKITCKIYDAQSAPPNAPLESVEVTVSPQPGGPREVALCLSQKGSPQLGTAPAGQLPTWRGRTYIGPLSAGQLGTVRPGVIIKDQLKALGIAIAAAGGEGFLWSCGSALVPVQSIFIDDEWDTQRRRGYRPITRVTQAV